MHETFTVHDGSFLQPFNSDSTIKYAALIVLCRQCQNDKCISHIIQSHANIKPTGRTQRRSESVILKFKALFYIMSCGDILYQVPSEVPNKNPSVRASDRPSTLSNINISETSWPIEIKFHLAHYWGVD